MGLAEGGNGRDAITKPVGLRAQRTALLGTEEALRCAALCKDVGGASEAPEGRRPAGRTGEGGPSRRAWHPPWDRPEPRVPFARQLLLGKKEAEPRHPAAPTEFRDSQKHTPVPIFLYPYPNGGGG